MELCLVGLQFVNKRTYNEKNNKTMSYLGENKILVDFLRNITPRNNYNVIHNNFTYYSNRFIDLSAFDFIDSSHLEHNFFASKLDGYTQMTVQQLSKYFGLYNFSVNQDPI